jgi:protein translocase SecG subunit
MILTYTQIAISVLLVIAILLQQRGGGLSGVITGSSLEYSTKRGAEKFIFYTTIVLAIAFMVVSLTRLF